MTSERETVEVDPALFQAVYDSPAALPGRHRWTTPESDVRRIEKLLNMPPRTIGAPLWVSGDHPDCPKCGRRITWYDIVASALKGVHDPMMIATVILGDRRYVNTGLPAAIPGVAAPTAGRRSTAAQLQVPQLGIRLRGAGRRPAADVRRPGPRRPG